MYIYGVQNIKNVVFLNINAEKCDFIIYKNRKNVKNIIGNIKKNVIY